MNRQSDLDNRSRQLNPNNGAYWQSRGCNKRPESWDKRLHKEKVKEQAEAKSAKPHR